jgi:hypothetical protein
MKFKLLLLFFTLSILIISMLGLKLYQSYKSNDIIRETNIALLSLKGITKFAADKTNDMGFILVQSEKENMANVLSSVKDKIQKLDIDIKEYSNLKGTDSIRSKLEVGYDEAAKKSGYVTPIEKIKACQLEIDNVVNFCNNRDQIRKRAIRNEMTLKSILKKPIAGTELPPDLNNVSKYSNDLLILVPQDTENNRVLLNSLNDTNLYNGMGFKLINNKHILEEINKISKTDDIKHKASEFYGSVKRINDTVHWYVPEEDDGKYDDNAYNSLLSAQANALSYYEAGNLFLNKLSGYCEEIKSQTLVYVSSNSYEDTSFSHSKLVSETATRRKSDGSTEHYTKYKTHHYTTDGRIFYYIITSVNQNGSNNNRIKAGEKDSDHIMNSFGAWKNWDYAPDQTQGYLIEYKPYGYDNKHMVHGGTYNLSIHIIIK